MAKSKVFHDVMEVLGKPEYLSSEVMLYGGDCLSSIQSLPHGIVDLTVTSPPYNIGKEYETSIELVPYLSWCTAWMKAVYDVTTADGTFWLNLGYVPTERGKAIPLPYLLWNLCPFFLVQEVVWNYGAGVAARTSFSPRNEKFLWYVKHQSNYYFDLDAVRDPDVKYPNQKKGGKLRCNPLGKNPTDVWNIPKVTSGTDRSSKERTPHPAQFPEALIERIVLASSREGDLILDPFLGSGTTAVVARRLGRKFLGFEIRPDYLSIAINRIAADMSLESIRDNQSSLFAFG